MFAQKRFLAVFLGLVLFTNTSAFADNQPPKLVSLGLNAATAMASKKDVVEGLKQTASDEYTGWLWDAVGGTEKFMTGNAEAEIPAAKDKVMKIVSTVQAIEKFAIAMTEGRYDDAAFTAIDEAVGALNHPLVTVTWEMAKLTYESHKLVMSTGAARDIEAIYGIVSNDRRMMGVIDPDSDSPAQIPVNAQTADYFFNKYIVTDGSARGLLESYVTTHLGQEWPEENWSSYMKSWMAVGSGVDTAKNAEVEMLAGEWRNKARGWIVQLLKEANKQAKVQWAQTRLRQQMAEFKRFADRVQHFYNNDMDQMIRDFLAIKANKEAEKELLKLPAKSQKAYNELQPKIAKMEDKDLKNAGTWDMQINDWQLNCLGAASRMERVNKGLSETLYAERNKWLKLSDELSAKVNQKKGQVSAGVVKEFMPERTVNAPQRGGYPDFYEAVDDRAKEMYQEYFASLFEEFEWTSVKGEVEIFDIRKKSEKITMTADPDTIKDKVIEQLNVGDFKGAQNIISFWNNDVAQQMRLHFGKIEEKIKEIMAKTPGSVTAAQEANAQADESYQKLLESVKPQQMQLSERMNEIIREHTGYMGTNWGAIQKDAEYKALQQAGAAISAKLRAFQQSTTIPARRKASVETDGWAKAKGLPLEALKRMASLYALLLKDVSGTLSDAPAAYQALASALQKKVNQYSQECKAILDLLPAPAPLKGNYWLMEDTLKKVSEGSYTHMAPKKMDGPVKVTQMTNFLSGMAPNADKQYLSEQLLATASDIETRTKEWDKGEKKYGQLQPIPSDEVEQYKVLVDPDFDPYQCQKKIKDAIRYAKTITAVVSKLKAAAQKAATDELNRETDADFVQNKVNTINAFFNGLQEKGLIKWGYGDYEIVLPPSGRDGMIRIEEPFPHYATREELQKFAQPIREAWNKMTAVSFAQANAPAYVAKWNQIMNLENVPEAKEDNFIAPNYKLPIYKSDLEKAEGLVARLKGSDDRYKDVMEEVAELVPGLLQVPTVLDKERDEQQARLYKLDLKQYYAKIKKPKKIYYYRIDEKAQEAIDSGALDHELGKIYADLGKRVEELHFEYYAYQQEQNKLKAEEQARKIQEEQRKKMEEEGKKTINAMDPFELAGYYGYSIEEARLNSRSLRNVRGDVILTKKDLIAGKMNFDVRLFTTDKMRTILLSEDGGRTWKELSVSKNLAFSIEPLPGKAYDLLLRIKTTDEREVRMKVFGGVNSIVYQDVSFEQLVAETVKKIADAYEQSNLSAFSSYISSSYLGNKAILEEGVRFDFDMFVNIQLTIYINRISRRGNMFVAETKWDKKQTPRKTGEEQRTSGNTTFMFMLEDGQMKIQNLRGDLIYATLSPEIAQAAGKSSTVVDQIRTARDDRNPTQPGAGETEDEGGLTTTASSSATLTVKTATFRSHIGAGPNEYIDFETDTTGAGASGDIFFEGDGFFSNAGVEVDQRGSGESIFNALDAVPGDFADEASGSYVCSGGPVYVIMTGSGNYLKMYIASSVENPGGSGWFDTSIKYAISTDGTTNLKTQ